MTPTTAQRLAPRDRPSGLPVLHMRWDALLFLHWRVEPAEIQRTLPDGLTVDTHEDAAWLGVVPFFMRRVHPTGLPCVPWLSDFLELNVRTYVFDRHGSPGVWFYSLLCDQPVAVELARRFFHLNYRHARLEAPVSGQPYLWHPPTGPAATFASTAPEAFQTATPGSLEFFLLERYILFSASPRGRIFSGAVHHRPYEFGSVTAAQWSFAPATAEGFADPGRPPDHSVAARPVQVEAWPIKKTS
jgi:hypothetical protein